MRDRFLSLGYDILKLQLMDTLMNVRAEGSLLMADSVGKPIFVFNRHGQEVFEVQTGTHSWDSVNPDHSYHIYYDIYEAYFDAPVTVTDSFYLAAHFESQQYEKENMGISVPSIYEFHQSFINNHFNPNPSYAHNYVLPKLNWKAQGGIPC